MDIFSLGCVLAELFLDGKSLFTLPKLLKYKNNDHDPSKELKAILHGEIENLILSMIDISPENRPSASACFEKASSIFPKFFNNFIFPYFCSILEMSITKNYDEIIENVYDNFEKIMFFVTGKDDDERSIEIPDLCIPNCKKLEKSKKIE